MSEQQNGKVTSECVRPAQRAGGRAGRPSFDAYAASTHEQAGLEWSKITAAESIQAPPPPCECPQPAGQSSAHDQLVREEFERRQRALLRIQRQAAPPHRPALALRAARRGAQPAAARGTPAGRPSRPRAGGPPGRAARPVGVHGGASAGHHSVRGGRVLCRGPPIQLRGARSGRADRQPAGRPGR